MGEIILKKLYLFCIIIILVGLVINTVIYIEGINNYGFKENNTVNDVKDSDGDITKELLERPIAVMINNVPESLPQSGIYGADYVYEMLVEGGLTRLMAVYTKGFIDKIGPVRSSRHNFLDLSLEYDAIYCYFGGSPKAFSDIELLKIPGLNGIVLDGHMYWRDKKRPAPHNAYTDTKKAIQYAKKYGYYKPVEIKHFTFNGNGADIVGGTALNVNIKYSYSHLVSFDYDINKKYYKRSMNQKPHMDEAINTQLNAKNIIIQFAKNSAYDDENRQEIYLVGSGKGYFITNGKYIEITWNKPTRQDRTVFYDKNNNIITLNNGQTWIEIVPIDAKIEIK